MEILIRHRVLRRLIWACNDCHLPVRESPVFNELSGTVPRLMVMFGIYKIRFRPHNSSAIDRSKSVFLLHSLSVWSFCFRRSADLFYHFVLFITCLVWGFHSVSDFVSVITYSGFVCLICFRWSAVFLFVMNRDGCAS